MQVVSFVQSDLVIYCDLDVELQPAWLTQPRRSPKLQLYKFNDSTTPRLNDQSTALNDSTTPRLNDFTTRRLHDSTSKEVGVSAVESFNWKEPLEGIPGAGSSPDE